MPPFLRRARDGKSAGLMNRDAFYNQLDTLIAGEDRPDAGVALIRVSNMGNYSLRRGMQAGDDLMGSFVDCLVRHLGRRCLATMENGSMFVVVVEADDVEPLLSDLHAVLAQDENAGSIRVNAGFCPQIEGVDAYGTAERARYALDRAEAQQGESVVVFDRELCQAFDKGRYVIDHIDDAITNGEIRAYSQPIVRVITGQVCEVEVLCRWESERFGMIYPDEFIPQLEKSLQIHKLDATVIRLACKQWRMAEDKGIAVPFGVNLSRLDFELCDIYEVVRDAMSTYDVPIEAVHIEVTESAATGNESLLKRGIDRFHEAGFRIYMDDFGTGYSSLYGLRGSTYDVMKLDKSLIDDVETSERMRVIVADTISMAKRLGMQTLCEGVETLEQLRFLRMVGCEKAQGYFFGRPTGHAGTMELLVEESERYEESGLSEYLDKAGAVNLFDGTHADTHGVEAGIFFGDTPVAVVESVGSHIFCLTSNAAFDVFLSKVGAGSFDEAISKISAGEAEMRTRFARTAQLAKETGEPQGVDFIAGGFFSNVSIEHVASTTERDAYLVKVSSISASTALERERYLEMALPFLYSIFKRIDLFDLSAGTSRNLYLNAPILRSHRMAGIMLPEIREFCDRNVHPADRTAFMNFYDMSTLDERVRDREGTYDVIVLRARVSPTKYTDHIFTLIPMTVEGRRLVLSTVRAIDTGASNSYQVSGDARISDTVLLKAVLDGIDRYVFWKDSQRRFLGANQAFLDYYGFPSLDAIVGKTDEDVGWHVNNEPFMSDEERVLQGDVVQRARGTCYDRNELRLIEANKRPIVVSGEIVGLLGYFRDLGPAEEERRPGGH